MKNVEILYTMRFIDMIIIRFVRRLQIETRTSRVVATKVVISVVTYRVPCFEFLLDSLFGTERNRRVWADRSSWRLPADSQTRVFSNTNLFRFGCGPRKTHDLTTSSPADDRDKNQTQLTVDRLRWTPVGDWINLFRGPNYNNHYNSISCSCTLY